MTSDLPSVADGEPIFEFLKRHLDPGGRMVPEGEELPDEPKDDETIRWAPGAFDGAFGHHGGGEGEDQRARSVGKVLIAARRRPSRRRLRALHRAVADDDALTLVDSLLEHLAHVQLDVTAVREIAVWLAATSPKRGPVKVGLALLGAVGVADHVHLVRTLGAHDEFTLFAATALQNGLAEPDSELWALAASVDGWGRIQCVERLRGTDDAQIKSWLLREGYRNSIMYEYTALIAAETGELLLALEKPAVDRALLTAAGDILSALISGGPAEDIDDYAQGADAIERFLVLMSSQAETLQDYLAVQSIRDYVTADEWSASAPGWDANRRDAFADAARQILGGPRWRDRAGTALQSEDDHEFWLARTVARDLGIDTFEASFHRIKQNPFGHEWFDAWRGASLDHAQRLVDLARTRLPLTEIASGPADAFGMGPGWEPHRALDWSLQALGGYPGVGSELVLAGLQSPVVRNRNMALRALQEWPQELWPVEAMPLVRLLADGDPNTQARELAGRVMRGEAEEEDW